MDKRIKIVLVTLLVVILILFRYEIKYIILELLRYKSKSPGVEEELKTVHPLLRYRIAPMIKKAEQDGKVVKVTSAVREEGHNEEVGGAKYSCHLSKVKEAVDLNIGNLTMSSSKSAWEPYANISKDNGLRWGGDFSGYYDPVHFDLNLISNCKEGIEEPSERLIFGKFRPIW